MKIRLLIFTLLLIGAGACKKAGSAASGGKDCGDLDAMSARMRCDNNNVQFCSSYSQYKWMETQKCPAGKTCFIAADGKSGGCK